MQPEAETSRRVLGSEHDPELGLVRREGKEEGRDRRPRDQDSRREKGPA